METTPQTAPGQEIQPGGALSIGRYFTTAGVDPFDTVEWERRDARIGHGEKVAFEQLDVEFPTSWSQNATTSWPRSTSGVTWATPPGSGR